MDCSPRGSSVCGDSPGKNTGVGCHFLLQGSWHRDQIWSPALQADSLPLSHQGSFQVHFISEHWPLEMLLWTQKTEQTCISVSVENSNYRLLHRVERNLFIYDVKRVGKESACSTGDLGSIPGLGRSPGEGKGYQLQYSDTENSMDCIVHGVAKSWTRLSDFHFDVFWYREQIFRKTW